MIFALIFVYNLPNLDFLRRFANYNRLSGEIDIKEQKAYSGNLGHMIYLRKYKYNIGIAPIIHQKSAYSLSSKEMQALFFTKKWIMGSVDRYEPCSNSIDYFVICIE